MTQAFNLSQLANRVNTSGQLDASTALFNQVPAANGGTGRSSVTTGRLLVGAGTSVMTELAGTTTGDAVTWNGTAWVAGTVGGAMPTVQTFVAPGTYTKPASIKGIKVTVVGAGGNGGPSPGTNTQGGGGGGGGAAIEYIPAPSIPGPVSVTAGPGTNSFGGFCSATAGSNGPSGPGTSGTPGGAGGQGSGGNFNMRGGSGQASQYQTVPQGNGGSSILGGGGGGVVRQTTGAPGGNYGGGGSGTASTSGSITGGTGAPGIVIVEEFY
jgi:hypothetical protein